MVSMNLIFLLKIFRCPHQSFYRSNFCTLKHEQIYQGILIYQCPQARSFSKKKIRQLRMASFLWWNIQVVLLNHPVLGKWIRNNLIISRMKHTLEVPFLFSPAQIFWSVTLYFGFVSFPKKLNNVKI